MNYGAVIPTCEIGNDPLAIRDFAQAAEGLGYQHLLIYDHVLGAEHADREPALTGPYTETDPFHEPFVLYGYLAGVTKRIELATGVIILPQRQTVLVAKQAAEIDLLSEGRFRLGVGTGWNWVEYDALGVPFEGRGERLEAQVELLRALWSEDLLEHRDDFHQVERAALLPRPTRPIPIWFGGMGPRPVRRAAKMADGFTFGGSNRFMQKLGRLLLEELEKQGRDPAEFGIEVVVGFGEGPDAWRKDLDAWREIGVNHFSMRAMSTGTKLIGETDPGFTTPRQHIEALETFKKAMS